MLTFVSAVHNGRGRWTAVTTRCCRTEGASIVHKLLSSSATICRGHRLRNWFTAAHWWLPLTTLRGGRSSKDEATNKRVIQGTQCRDPLGAAVCNGEQNTMEGTSTLVAEAWHTSREANWSLSFRQRRENRPAASGRAHRLTHSSTVNERNLQHEGVPLE